METLKEDTLLIAKALSPDCAADTQTDANDWLAAVAALGFLVTAIEKPLATDTGLDAVNDD